MTKPRINHVAMSVPAAVLDDDGRREIVDFHKDVFGWTEMAPMTKPDERLVLQAYSYDQFVFLIAEDDPMSCPRLDHFGMAVETQAEFDDMLAKAKAKAETDDRVDVIDATVENFDGYLTLHSFYVRFLLPMMVEVQLWEWAEGIDPKAIA